MARLKVNTGRDTGIFFHACYICDTIILYSLRKGREIFLTKYSEKKLKKVIDEKR